MGKIADFSGNIIVADGFVGPIEGSVAPEDITIASDVGSTLVGGNLQAVLEALAARIDAVESE